MLGTAGTWSLELFRPGNGVLGENSWNTKGVGEEGQTWKCTNKDPWTLCSLDHAACQGRAPNALREERELPRYSGLRDPLSAPTQTNSPWNFPTGSKVGPAACGIQSNRQLQEQHYSKFTACAERQAQ